MKKAITFSIEEFEYLVLEVTYGVMSFYNTLHDGWYWCIAMDDDDWETFADIHGEDAVAEVDEFTFDEMESGDFVYSAIGKKFEATVEEIIIDFSNERVAVIFE